ncbi:MAG: NFACT family protein [Helicobacteraceae bacterium]|nr:NFACT family protein [Helicobacteraceae bacterium]
MQLDLLQKFSAYLTQNPPLKLRKIYRIGDNLFKLDINGELFYIDLTRGKSNIFITDELLLSPRLYNAPFDISLQKLCFNALILEAKLDGYNRILKINLSLQNSYKSINTTMQIEFTGRNTNLILLDSNKIILDALRHITKEQSFREVKINKPLLDLPQPKKIPTIKDNGELFSALRENFNKLKAKELEVKKQNSLNYIKNKISQLNLHLQKLENRQNLEKKAQELANLGQLIIKNLYLHKDFKGDKIMLDNIEITLPKDSANLSNAAQIFFTQSKKLSKKAKNIHIQEENLKEKITFYEQLEKMIQKVTNINDLQILDSNKTKETKHKNTDKERQYESFFIEGFKVSIGKNEKENIALLKDAKADDIWMHIRGIPSSHCIIHSGKAKLSAIILQKAANILMGFTKNTGANYTIDYTKRKFVKITQGASVTYGKEQTLDLKKDSNGSLTNRQCNLH